MMAYVNFLDDNIKCFLLRDIEERLNENQLLEFTALPCGNYIGCNIHHFAERRVRFKIHYFCTSRFIYSKSATKPWHFVKNRNTIVI